MFDDEFADDQTPIAFFITFRTYGSWLHGDERASVDRFHNKYGTPKLAPNWLREQFETGLLKMPPVRLSPIQRKVVAEAIRETCKKQNWGLWARNVRTNHVHVVVTANCNSKTVRSRLKAGATKLMRERRCWNRKESPWADKGSRRKIFNRKSLIAAIEYVLYDQGE